MGQKDFMGSFDSVHELDEEGKRRINEEKSGEKQCNSEDEQETGEDEIEEGAEESESSWSDAEEQEFMKGFQFGDDEWDNEREGAADEDKSEENDKKSSLASSEIGEEETEERIEESGQEYNRLSVQVVPTVGNGDARASKSETDEAMEDENKTKEIN